MPIANPLGEGEVLRWKCESLARVLGESGFDQTLLGGSLQLERGNHYD